MRAAAEVVAQADLATRYVATRRLTEEIAAPLSAEDQQVQSMPDVSPTKWHRAHTSWFFETFVLVPWLPGYEVVDPRYGYLYNSYYEAVGRRHPRAERGLLSRPSCAEVAAYRAHVDAAMLELLDAPLRAEAAALVELGIHHEQQHQELALMDVKHVLGSNPLRPAYRTPAAGASTRTTDAPAPLRWVEHPGGVVWVGAPDYGFAFDNERPRHRVVLRPFRLAHRCVTASEWLAFIEDGGYHRPELWLSDGWAAVQAHRWEAPLYWEREAEGWLLYTLGGQRRLDPAEPVCHVSFYEADAFARWAGARLPTEAEWEAVAADYPVEGNLLDLDGLHPRAAEEGAAVAQLWGDVWEWTNSAYLPYPGFRPAAGAVGEYNGKFMVGQHVLRGGCCLTPTGHLRPTYRNFFPPGSRWMFAGVRLAEDA